MRRGIVTTIVATSLVLGTSVAYADEWTQIGFDAAGTGINPNETTISPTSASRWRTDWQHRSNDVRRYTTNPLITDDTVYVGGDRLGGDGVRHPTVWAYNLDNGSLRWSERLPCATMGDTIAIGQGRLIVGLFDCPVVFFGYEGRLYLLDRTNGARLARIWSHDPYTITIDSDLAIVPDSNDTITVVDLTTMAIRNLVDYDRDHEWAPVPLAVVNDEAWLGYSSTPAFSNGVGLLYGTWGYGKPLDNGDPTHSMTCPSARETGLCATDLATGEVLWEKVFDYPDDFADVEYSAPIVVGDTVYVHGPDVMRALDLRSGSLLWESEAASPGAPNYSWLRPTYTNGVVFVESFDAIRNEVIMLGFDASTGDLVTRRPRSSKLGPLGGHHTAIANGRLVTSIPGIRVSTFDRP